LLLELFEYRHPEQFIFGEFFLGNKVSSRSAEEVHGILVPDVIDVRRGLRQIVVKTLRHPLEDLDLDLFLCREWQL